MLAKKYRSELVSISSPIKGIYTLRFKSLARPYKYKPGQFLHLAHDDSYQGVGQWPESRCFSMQSNPAEETIRITYAVKGKFTQEMRRILKVGSLVWLKLPYGDLFTQPHNKGNTIFISGGTGVTPYLSLFTGPVFADYYKPILYAGFREEQMNVYRTELSQAKLINNLFSVHVVYEQPHGFINIDRILANRKHDSYFFISGPPEMLKSFKLSLINGGVHENQVLSDDWE
jgi:ferredoxin-NADP reductase